MEYSKSPQLFTILGFVTELLFYIPKLITIFYKDITPIDFLFSDNAVKQSASKYLESCQCVVEVSLRHLLRDLLH